MRATLSTAAFFQLGFGVQAVDLDNDAQLELVVANGHVHHNAQTGYAQYPQILRRTSVAKYEVLERDQLPEYFRDRHVGRALWCLDFDRDHQMDVVVTHQGESTALLHNQTAGVDQNHWLRLRLVGTDAARDAVGAVVTVTLDNTSRTNVRLAGDGFFCSREALLHFGFGPAANSSNVRVEVTWPRGGQETFQAPINQECLVVQGQGEVFSLTED